MLARKDDMKDDVLSEESPLTLSEGFDDESASQSIGDIEEECKDQINMNFLLETDFPKDNVFAVRTNTLRQTNDKKLISNFRKHTIARSISSDD